MPSRSRRDRSTLPEATSASSESRSSIPSTVRAWSSASRWWLASVQRKINRSGLAGPSR